MRCRAECCHRAASRILLPPSPHVWVGDDDLAHAFSRFVSLSSPNCVAQKRHGSNVPGPLEFRRRMAKRRMMGLAQPCPPPMPDFGSLFGTTPVDVPALWKPPTQHKLNPPSTWPPLSASSAKRRPEPVYAQKPPPPPARPRKQTFDDYAKLLVACNTLPQTSRLHATLHPNGEVPVDFSKAVLQRLLNQTLARPSKVKTLDEELFQPVELFLQGDVNQESARNTHAYLSWLTHRPISTSTFRALVHIVADKIILGTIEHEELQAIIQDLQFLLQKGVSQPERDDAFLYAFQTITDAISNVFVLRADRHLCQTLLVAASSLPPSHPAIPLVLKPFDWLPKHETHLHIQIVGECLFQWARKTARHNPKQEPHPDDALPSPLLAFIDALPKSCAGRIIVHATSKLISFFAEKASPSDSFAPDTAVRQRITHWLYLLRRCNHLWAQPHDGATWVQLYSLFAQAFPPRELAAHFASVSPVNAARLILRHWISPQILTSSRLNYGGSRKADTNVDRFSKYGVSYTLSRTVRKEQITEQSDPTVPVVPNLEQPDSTIPAIQQQLASPQSTVQSIHLAFEARLADYIHEEEAVTAPFADLLIILQKHQLDYTEHLDQIVQLLMQYHEPKTIFRFVMKLMGRNDDRVLLHPGVALTLIHFFIQSDSHSHAYNVFKLCPEVWPSLCPELLFALIDKQSITTESLFKILHRPEFSNSLPTQLRDEPNNPLSLERIKLIEHMAYALANSPHLTPRQAFRRVRDCLHYLQARSAPLSSITSRALVTAGVTRYLQAGKWVSTMRFIWILDYVRQIEGDDVADMLDKVTFKWRTDNLEERAQGEFRSRELELAKAEADEKAREYRQQLGHDSRRWKRKQKLWKPFLADVKGHAMR